MKFSMAGVFGRTFFMLAKGIVPLAVVTVLVYLLPYLALAYGLQAAAGIGIGNVMAFQGGFGAVSLIAILAGYLIVALHISAVSEVALLTQAGTPVKLSGVLTHAAVNAGPVLVIIVICLVGWVLSGILLLVPGFIFGTFFSVVIPAYIAERRGIPGAFSRSRHLTKGHRWGIFGMWLLILTGYYLVIGLTLMPVLQPIMKQAMSDAGHGIHTAAPVLPFATTAWLATIGSVLSGILMVFNVGFYVCLRAEKDMNSQGVETVFE